MEDSIKKQILRLIRDAEDARAWALNDENREGFGYPYVSGYATSTLKQIKELAASL